MTQTRSGISQDKVNILLVDDQPGKLLSYEVILRELNENLVVASSGREALDLLLKMDVAVLLVDVCMPELDGFQLAAMIREHPRFEKTAIIFISAVQMSDEDRIRGYEMGAVDYVPVPVVPQVLRAKVRIFTELYRKSRQLEQLNADLERRVADRTSELERSTERLRLAQQAGGVVTWEWSATTQQTAWGPGMHELLGVDPASVEASYDNFFNSVHPDDRQLLQSSIDAAMRGDQAFEAEFRILKPDGSLRWLASRGEIVRNQSGKIISMRGVTYDVTQRKFAESALRENENRLRLAVDIGRLGTWDWNIETDEMNWSDGFYKILGHETGKVNPSYSAWRARVHPEDLASVEAESKRAIAENQPFYATYRIVQPNGKIIWCESRRFYEYDSQNKPKRMIAVAMDVTDHKLAEEHQRLMVRELHHRVKNTLATVQAIASSTARSAPDMESFRRSFADRIVSLSKTHTLLVSNSWDKIVLRDLLTSELSSFDDGKSERIRLHGPQIELASDAALSLGMAIHEMTTNAVKYGALSKPEGSVEVTWVVRPNGAASGLRLVWTEQGGPVTVPPNRKGFGSQLIEKVIVDKLGANVDMQFKPEGLCCTISMPFEGQYADMQAVA